MKLIKEAEFLTRGYGRTGGKDNRRQQRARMLAFAEHCAATGAHSFGQVGKNHVISYWKAHRTLSPATAYAHWLAIRELWRLAGKPSVPPEPRTTGAMESD
jgi:hypothetical protein